jgi:glycerol-1-phosphate dehydrogenase [NAD(P)+]
MTTAGSSRPCSGADHEILHAIDHLFPGTARHGELAGAATLFTSYLRGDAELAAAVDGCLTRHGLPRLPRDLGLSEEQFVRAVLHAPATRPDRFTVLEHLALGEREVSERVRGFVGTFGR